MNVSVVIPARNEEAVIGKMVTMLLAVYPLYIKQVIVVNDGSTDKTGKIVQKLAKKDSRIKLINRTSRFSQGHGVGLALREGLRHVAKTSSHILTLDADFIRNVPDLFDFFTKIKDYDGLIGSRYLERHSLIRYPLFKRLCNRAFHFLVRLSLGIRVSDLTNNFKLYKKEVWQRLPLSASDYAVNAETGLYPILLGYKIGELPVPWYARDRNMGKSKFVLLRVAPSYVRVLLRALRGSLTSQVEQV